jgi:flagellar hook-associated protein 1 FlgK
MGTQGRGGLPDARVSAREYLGDVTSIQAMRAASAERAAENDGVLAEELDFQKAGISGVNLDEEMAHLLELQQAYSTSARLITAADEMLQTLLNAKR